MKIAGFHNPFAVFVLSVFFAGSVSGAVQPDCTFEGRTVSAGEELSIEHSLGTYDILVQVWVRSDTRPRWSSLNVSAMESGTAVSGLWYELADRDTIIIHNDTAARDGEFEIRGALWRYDDEERDYSKQKEEADLDYRTVPRVKGMIMEQGGELLESEGWEYMKIPGKAPEGTELGNRIIEQYPPAGTSAVPDKTTVKLILEVVGAVETASERERGPCIVGGKVSGRLRLAEAMGLYERDSTELLIKTEIESDGDYRFENITPGKYTLKIIAKGGKMLKVTPRSRDIECTGEGLNDLDFLITGSF